MADRRPRPEFWATSIAKVMVGEQPCDFSVWLPGHFDIAKRDRGGDLTGWKIRHTEMLRKQAESLRAEGWKVDKERYWRVEGKAATLAGKIDIIAQAPDRRPLLVDTKGGRPSDSDVAQVLIYMVMLPIAWGSSMIFNGRVVYETHQVDITPREAEEFKFRLFETMRRMGVDVPPPAHPSRDACKFCPVGSADCAVRYVEPDAVKTELF